MNKRILIISIVVLAIIGIVAIVIFTGNDNAKKVEQENIEEENGTSKLEKIQEKILSTQNYSISLTLNNDNYKIISKNGNSVKIEVKDEGKEKSYIVKNGNTYLLSENSQKYNEYENNTSMLNTFESNIQDILKRKYAIGTESIENKEYRYEEFENTSAFLINYKGNVDNNNTKTRLYFEGNNLKYVKTYVGKIEQLLKVNLEFNTQKGEYDV